MKKRLVLTSILLLAILAGCANSVKPVTTVTVIPNIPVVATRQQSDTETSPMNTEQPTQESADQNPEPGNLPVPISIAAQDLQTPWEIAFLPDGRLLVTERSGTLAIIEGHETVRIPIADVFEQSESGLLGLALHPEFTSNQLLYLYLTYQGTAGILNRVERYRLDGESLVDKSILIDQIPGSNNHDGGRMEFGPDGMLYITTGDAQNSANSQDTSSLAGKILRLHDDGSIPGDNPFGNAVYSYGHRNPQGLGWDGQGRLWSTEHGPSGLGSGFDELNLIEIGGNYGWPEIQGDQTREGMITPVLHSGADETWAPGDLEIVDGVAWFVGLRGSTLYSVPLDNISPETIQRYFVQEFGRLRALRLGPDGYLYMGTSNTDGRGSIRDGDDKIFRVDPKQFPGL